MKIEFKEDHLSIKKFSTVETPNFMVLTGRNGSGKTHLLKAIEMGKVFLNGKLNNQQRIIYFDFNEFRLNSERPCNAEELRKQRIDAWNNFSSWCYRMKSIREINNTSNYDKFKALCSIAKNHDLPFSKLTENEISDSSLLVFYLCYKDLVDKNLPVFNSSYRLGIAVKKLLNTLLVPITWASEEEFFECFQPYNLKKEFLPAQFSDVIFEYYIKLEKNDYNQFLNEKKGRNIPVKNEEEFIEAHGIAPWKILNEILKSYFTDLKIVSPEGEDLQDEYQAKIVRRSDGLELDLNDLSSGEKTMIALAASIFKGETDNYFPDVLLLDEIDTSLHPSMIKNLLNVIEKVFLSRGVEVILVTHSPTTVALSNDENVYLMNSEGENRIESSSRSKALSILTEGYMTLDEGIRILDDLGEKEIVIISEGNNSIILKKLIEVYEIENVGVIENIESKSGTKQLEVLYTFFTKLSNHKKILFVWDCDFKRGDDLPEKNGVFTFVIPHNVPNTLALNGIENAFDEDFFDKEFITDVKSEKRDRAFISGKKKDFSSYVTQCAKIEDFKNFDSLIDKLKQLSEN